MNKNAHPGEYPYLYEMHQHTAGCSACASAQPEEVVRALKADGFAGMVLTDHFYHGNTAIDRRLPWADFVQSYIDTYQLAKAVGDQLDFDVLFGLEEDVGGKDVLLYGITPQWVLDHPELRDLKGDRQSLEQLRDLVHEGGGLLYQAHPFRGHSGPWETLPPECLDGVEGYDASNGPMDDAMAVAFAKKHGLPMVAGSDGHLMDPRGRFATLEEARGRFGIACRQRIRTEGELAAVLRENAYELYTDRVFD